MVTANKSRRTMTREETWAKLLKLGVVEGNMPEERWDLAGVDLVQANLFCANLSGVGLAGADLLGANLFDTDLTNATLYNANLRTANLISAKLDGATLTGAKLYEIQRDGWSIKDVICEKASWDMGGETFVEYKPGEFERLYGGTVIEIEYPGGIEEYQYHSWPYIITRLQEQFGDKCTLHLKSVEQAPSSGKAKISLSVNEGYDAKDISGQIKEAVKTSENEYKERYGKLIELLANEGKSEIAMLKQENAELREVTLDLFMAAHKKQKARGLLHNGGNCEAKHGEEKHLTVFISDLKGFSSLSENVAEFDKEEIVEKFGNELKRFNVTMDNTWGDAVFAGFENSEDAIDCVLRIQTIMQALKLPVRIGMDYGKVCVRFNEIMDRLDGSGDCINFAARLEPLCDTGRVLVSENLRDRLINSKKYTFEKATVTLKKGAEGHKGGEQITAYYVY
ncbi:MAG: pentapeptide repeat-containing protein [Nitrospirae bacterium]|nr:pentapeptide repeat-containing protein [Nitrospirota bacterium]